MSERIEAFEPSEEERRAMGPAASELLDRLRASCGDEDSEFVLLRFASAWARGVAAGNFAAILLQIIEAAAEDREGWRAWATMARAMAQHDWQEAAFYLPLRQPLPASPPPIPPPAQD